MRTMLKLHKGLPRAKTPLVPLAADSLPLAASDGCSTRNMPEPLAVSRAPSAASRRPIAVSCQPSALPRL